MSLPTKWTPEKKREYARERYKRLKAQKSNGDKKPHREIKSKSFSKRNPPIKKIQSLKSEMAGTLSDSTPISLTGNPFVDTGLAVVALKSNLDSIDKLNLGHLRTVHRDGMWLAKEAQKSKSFTMIFTRNSLLTQFPKNDPKKIRETRVKMQAAITSKFLDEVGAETEEEYCECCGNEKSVNLSELVNNALSKFDEQRKVRFIGRDWFPLAGSMGSDAQALPSASRSANLCAKCLLAVQYLPLGVRLFGNELAVFQSTSPPFWYEFVRDIHRKIQSRVSQGVHDILGSKQGRAGVVTQLLDLFKELQERRKDFTLDENEKLFVWRFANSTAPNVEIDQIPSHALSFLWKASRNLGPEIKNILARERVPDHYSFFGSLISKRDYFGLYPGKMGKERDYAGASHDLFSMYHTEILGKNPNSLKAAYEIAKAAVAQLDNGDQDTAISTTSKNRGARSKDFPNKVLERLSRKEAFKERATRSRFRKIMTMQARAGKFSFQTYLDLFPYTENSLQVSQTGWDLLRYYVGAIARYKQVDFEALDSTNDSPISQSPPIALKVVGLASAIFQSYVERRGAERFELDILNRLERNQLNVRWLRIEYMKLAREQSGFGYFDWIALCHPAQSKWWTISELYFQLRLLWSQWLNESPAPVTKWSADESLSQILESSGLPNNIAGCLVKVLDAYVSQRGLDRFERDVLLRLQSGEIGVGWFFSKLISSNYIEDIGEEELNEFLIGPSGNPEISEKVFQMGLFLNNAYRFAKSQPSAPQLIAKWIVEK